MGTKKRFPGLFYRKDQMHSQDAAKLNDAIKANEGYTKRIEYSAYDYPQPDVNLDERVHGDGVGESNWFKKTVEEKTPVRHTVTFSCAHGSVGATVDGVGIQSPAQVIAGKTVVFTITPDEGYEYTGTNPETVIVNADVTKAYECTQVVSWTGLKFTSTGTSTMKWVIYSNGPAKDIQYSIDQGANWTSLTSVASGSATAISFTEMWVKGTNTTYADSFGASKFEFGGDDVAASGNVMSLINSETFESLKVLTGAFTFKNMFDGCTSLVLAPDLPATTLITCCYGTMFRGCSKLAGPVNISATSPYYEETSSACNQMFENAGTATGAGGVINVYGSDSDTWASNAGIDTSKWTINVINEEE